MTQKLSTTEYRKLAPRRKRPVEHEHFEQVALATWAKRQSCTVPELALLFAIPNGGKRSRAVAGKLKAEGVKAGIPDLCLPVARGKYHGLFIELKAKGGRMSESQFEWGRALSAQGYCVHLCVGWGAAKTAIEDYLAQKEA